MLAQVGGSPVAILVAVVVFSVLCTFLWLTVLAYRWSLALRLPSPLAAGLLSLAGTEPRDPPRVRAAAAELAAVVALLAAAVALASAAEASSVSVIVGVATLLVFVPPLVFQRSLYDPVRGATGWSELMRQTTAAFGLYAAFVAVLRLTGATNAVSGLGVATVRDLLLSILVPAGPGVVTATMLMVGGRTVAQFVPVPAWVRRWLWLPPVGLLAAGSALRIPPVYNSFPGLLSFQFLRVVRLFDSGLLLLAAGAVLVAFGGEQVVDWATTQKAGSDR